MRAILLVDQKPSTAILMKTYLTAGGYDVDHTRVPTPNALASRIACTS